MALMVNELKVDFHVIDDDNINSDYFFDIPVKRDHASFLIICLCL